MPTDHVRLFLIPLLKFKNLLSKEFHKFQANFLLYKFFNFIDKRRTEYPNFLNAIAIESL